MFRAGERSGIESGGSGKVRRKRILPGSLPVISTYPNPLKRNLCGG